MAHLLHLQLLVQTLYEPVKEEPVAGYGESKFIRAAAGAYVFERSEKLLLTRDRVYWLSLSLFHLHPPFIMPLPCPLLFDPERRCREQS